MKRFCVFTYHLAAPPPSFPSVFSNPRRYFTLIRLLRHRFLLHLLLCVFVRSVRLVYDAGIEANFARGGEEVVEIRYNSGQCKLAATFS